MDSVPVKEGDEMQLSLFELEAMVRDRICRVCSDRTVDGQCGLEEPSSCALFRLFPHVATAIQSTRSDDIRDYIQAIREKVCSICSEQAADGSCDVRRSIRENWADGIVGMRGGSVERRRGAASVLRSPRRAGA